ncbi:MAG: hypothetical protein AB9866_29470 [Syntrophobacteraceae bacterium]
MKENLGGIFDGFILLAIGGFAGFLILSGNYWYYLNPKFEWLTGLTAAMLIITGVVTATKAKRTLSISKLAIFLVFIALLASAAYFGIPRATQGQADSFAEGESEEEPRVTLDGIEYIKINLAELIWITEKQIPAKLSERYALRGIVKRSERLDDLGYFAVVRNLMTCCLADSIGIGLPVKYSNVNGFSDGQWVAVYGTLERMGQRLPREGLRPDRMRLITISRTYGLIPDQIVKIEEPDIPFIFDARDDEPYAY